MTLRLLHRGTCGLHSYHQTVRCSTDYWSDNSSSSR